MNLQPGVTGAAKFSPSGAFRYWLDRRWDTSLPMCCWIMLNPSTANAIEDDPTVRRCQGYARTWGYGGLTVVNLFALCATDPAGLRVGATVADPVGPRNDEHILMLARIAKLTVCAWGVHGAYLGRGEAVRHLLAGIPLHVLGLTAGGHPKHPLYLKRELQPQLWLPAQTEVA